MMEPVPQSPEQLRETEENAGARVADDCFCQGCGARGYRFYCPWCAL